MLFHLLLPKIVIEHFFHINLYVSDICGAENMETADWWWP